MSQSKTTFILETEKTPPLPIPTSPSLSPTLTVLESTPEGPHLLRNTVHK